jgi:hypothetical protein
MKKHTIGFGAIIGLVIGVIAFMAGLWLPPDMLVSKTLQMIESPLTPLFHWMQGASPRWGTTTDDFKMLFVVLCYWTLLGILLGLGYRLFIGRRSSHAA